MSEPADAQPASYNDAHMREVLWERIGRRKVTELSKLLGFTPELQSVGENRRVFTDSGFEVTLWLGKDGIIGMINVRRV